MTPVTSILKQKDREEKSFALPLQIGVAFGAATLLGLTCPVPPVAVLDGAREVGRGFIHLIKIFAVPLLFAAILHAFLGTKHQESKGETLASRTRFFGWLVLVVVVNSLLALVIGLGLANLVHPGDSAPEVAKRLLSIAPAAVAPLPQAPAQTGLTLFLPKSVIAPFIDGAVLQLALLAWIVGLGLERLRKLKKLGDEHVKLVETLAATGYEVSLWVVHGLIRFVPIVIFLTVFDSVVREGLGVFQLLGPFVFVVTLGLLSQLVVYGGWIYWRGIGVRRVWKESRMALWYAFGANSSLATLPLTFESLKRLGVSAKARAFGAGITTNFNQDGILLYEAAAVLFVGQIYGFDWSLSEQIGTSFLCLGAAIGVAGIPEAGLISLMLVLTTLKLPLELVPILLSVDFFTARLRSVVNVASDLTVSLVIDQETK